ncbi:MAG: YtxH domain-containing protein [Candidatus Dormibacteria bacterium]
MKRMLMGVAVGAGAMYLLDPDHGAERRGKLLGFYSENKDTMQDYAQTATQAAVTVSHTAASAASTVADKAGEMVGKSDDNKTDDAKTDAAAPKSSNGKGSTENVDSLLETRDASRRSNASTLTDPAPGETSPGLGGSLSS